LPTQRSPSGRAPASSSENRPAAAPLAAAVALAMAAVASQLPSSTSSTCQWGQGGALASRLPMQAAMLASSL